MMMHVKMDGWIGQTFLSTLQSSGTYARVPEGRPCSARNYINDFLDSLPPHKVLGTPPQTP